MTLWERLEALESKVAKNSRNSSQPPSSDGLRKTNSLREPSGNKPGAQLGHKGSTLKRTAEPTEAIDHPLLRQCTRSHSTLPLAQSVVAERRQVIDVPASAFDVIEHRTLAVTCGCGQAHVSRFPTGVNESVQYGRNVRALAVHLTQGQMLPYARAAELIFEMMGMSVSPATLLAWICETRLALRGTADLIARQLHHAPVTVRRRIGPARGRQAALA
ncbi:Transposase [Janthinobacterium sp. CG23_2]|nr:Transposase [Janthinobacterium sp. CG23_2]CUU32555.1 Transposase [Janthinobacterium sp. CG23_2]